MNLLVLLTTLLGAGTLFFLALALTEQRHAVHQRLADLQLAPDAETRGAKHSFFKRVLHEERRSQMEKRLQEAGWYKVTPQQMVMRSVGACGIGAGIGVLLVFVLHMHAYPILFIAAFSPIYGLATPNFLLNAAIAQRKVAINHELPDFLDIVSTTVEAGIAVNGAFGHAVDVLDGPLGDELRAVMSDIRVGRTRADALTAMAARVNESDLTKMVVALVQAERVGGNLGALLDELAREARDRRLAKAEEIAAQMSVKMVIPMGIFMLPTIFIIIFGSVAADYFGK